MGTKQKKIAIISRESDSKTLDVSMLEEELLRRGCRVKVLSKLLTKEKSIKALGYIGHVAKQQAAIMASDVVVLDTYCIPASMIPHGRGTRIVQIWHALGAVKKFGWQTVGREGGSSEKVARLMRMHRGYDYVVSPSDITAEYFCEAFHTDKDKVAKYGLPRIDYIKSVASGERQADMERRILSQYPQLAGTDRKTILDAPTFRRGSSVDLQSLIEALDPAKYDLVVKLHPLYRAGNTDPEETSFAGTGQLNVIYDEAFTSYDWLAAADIIISDYSSLVIETTLTDKPLFIYAYDLEEYSENTGLNMDFYSEPIAPYVFKDAASLAACIDKTCGNTGADGQGYDMEALHAFRDRYIDIDTDNCTAALAEFIISLA